MMLRVFENHCASLRGINRALISLCLLLSACGENGLTKALAVAQVSGAICDESTHYFVADATVVLTEYDGKGTPLTSQTTKTDQTGHFTIKGVDAGTQKIHAEKGGFSYDTQVTVQGRANITLPDPTPACSLPTGTITGKICDQGAGKWLDGAVITVDGPSGMISAPSATDDMGAAVTSACR